MIISFSFGDLCSFMEGVVVFRESWLVSEPAIAFGIKALKYRSSKYFSCCIADTAGWLKNNCMEPVNNKIRLHVPADILWYTLKWKNELAEPLRLKCLVMLVTASAALESLFELAVLRHLPAVHTQSKRDWLEYFIKYNKNINFYLDSEWWMNRLMHQPTIELTLLCKTHWHTQE